MKTKIYLLFSLLLFAQSFVAQELSLIKDISTNASIKSSNPSYFTKINDKIYFAADDQINGQELWISDGTEQGTFMLKDINIVKAIPVQMDLLLIMEKYTLKHSAMSFGKLMALNKELNLLRKLMMEILVFRINLLFLIIYFFLQLMILLMEKNYG